MRSIIIASFSFLAATIPAVASAAVCDSLTLDDDAQEVLVGQYGTVNSFNGPTGPVEWFYQTQDLGICWRDDGGSWHVERLDCDASSDATDEFRFDLSGGDDYVSTILPEHTVGFVGQPDFVRVGPYTGTEPPSFPGPHFDHAFKCDGAAIGPWPSTFDFQMYVDMGEGADTYHGGPARDRVASNFAELMLRWVGWPVGFESEFRAPGDNAEDMLCGGEGDDELLGDHDNDWQQGEEELLDGEGGTDTCDGDPFIVGDPAGSSSPSDVTPGSCETREDAWFTDTYFDCSDTANAFEVIAF